jgi:hypothetical protein
MCNEYKNFFPNLVFQEDTLKDCFQNALKELKMGTSNEGDFAKWWSFDSIEGHKWTWHPKYSQKVTKCEITSFNPFQIPRSTTLTPTFNSMQEGPSIPSFGPSIIYLWAYIHQQIKWHPKTKAKVLQVQFNSFATMSRKM